jgi:hypothetical protein
MSEDSLNHLSINTVMGLLVQSMKELSIARNINDQTEIRAKTEEVETLKRFLVAKRAEFSPGYNF